MSSVFVSFEGPEGGGKSTQLELLYQRLTAEGVPVCRTREPGGTRIGEGIRDILLDPEHGEMSIRAEVLLFAAARAQHVHERLQPALACGQVVLCDRYVDATFAYQGSAGGANLGWLDQVTQYATGGLMPELTVLLDLAPEVGLQRKRADHRAGSAQMNRIDQRELEYHQSVREGLLARARADPVRFLVLDATCSREELAEAIWQRTRDLLRARKHLAQ